MITLTKNLSPKLRERIVQLAVTLRIKGKTTTEIGQILNVRRHDIGMVVRGLKFSTIGFAKSVYKGEQTVEDISAECRGILNPKRTLQEAYLGIQGTIVEFTPEIKEKMAEMEREQEKDRQLKADLRAERRKTSSTAQKATEFIAREKAQKEWNTEESQRIVKDEPALLFDTASIVSETTNKIVVFEIDGVKVIAIIAPGSKLIIENN